MKPYRRKDIKNIPGKLCISKGVVVFNEATLETGLVGNVSGECISVPVRVTADKQLFYGRCRNAPERLPGSGYGTEDCGTASVEQTASGMGQAQRRIVRIHVYTQRRAAGEGESFGRACHIGGRSRRLTGKGILCCIA